jgi:hypothetical protein
VEDGGENSCLEELVPDDYFFGSSWIFSNFVLLKECLCKIDYLLLAASCYWSWNFSYSESASSFSFLSFSSSLRLTLPPEELEEDLDETGAEILLRCSLRCSSLALLS